MAARLDLYALVHDHHLELYDDIELLDAQHPHADDDAGGGADDGAPTFLGFVSACDDDEQLLFDLLSLAAEVTGADFDARRHGCGYLPMDGEPHTIAALEALAAGEVRGVAPGDAQVALAESWLAVLIDAAGKAHATPAALGWRMRYDRGGSTDDGADEFPTAHS